MEILLRLPVKSLMRFSCVLKSWLSLITSPQFINRHLITGAYEEDRQHVVFTTFNIFIFYLVQCPLKSLLLPADKVNTAEIKTVKVDYFSVEMPEVMEIMGCYNGKFCIIVDFENAFFLWNPSTRKYKKLPDLHDFYSELKAYDYYNKYGFGYDEAGDDYKVVTFRCYKDYQIDHNLVGSNVMVYSAKAESWTSIGKFQVGIPTERGDCVFLNGKFHWATAEDDGLHVVFLLDTKTYGSLDFPVVENGKVLGTSEFELRNFRGSLCVIYLDYFTKVEYVWVVKEYGVRSSWIKVLTIPNCPYIDIALRTPLFTLEDGRFLLVCPESLELYDPKDNSTTVLLYLHNEQAVMYVESLVPP